MTATLVKAAWLSMPASSINSQKSLAEPSMFGISSPTLMRTFVMPYMDRTAMRCSTVRTRRLPLSSVVELAEKVFDDTGWEKSSSEVIWPRMVWPSRVWKMIPSSTPSGLRIMPVFRPLRRPVPFRTTYRRPQADTHRCRYPSSGVERQMGFAACAVGSPDEAERNPG